MQRVEPRSDFQAQTQTQDRAAQSSSSAAAQNKQKWQIPTGFASTGSNPHTQSFEEIYGVPENFLEIEVCVRAPSCTKTQS